jgi:hypothetical protein
MRRRPLERLAPICATARQGGFFAPSSAVHRKKRYIKICLQASLRIAFCFDGTAYASKSP